MRDKIRSIFGKISCVVFLLLCIYAMLCLCAILLTGNSNIFGFINMQRRTGISDISVPEEHTMIHPIVELWPFVSLAARYTYDMDNDPSDGKDYIEDALGRMVPGINVRANFRRIYPGTEFTYLVELPDKIVQINLGTRNSKGWYDRSGNLNALPFIDRTHRGFYRAGQDTFAEVKHTIVRNVKPYWIAGHSKGGPRSVETARHALVKLGVRVAGVVQYCPPPAYSRKGAKRYESYHIPTWTVISGDNDIVDNVGKLLFWRLLFHVGEPVQLKNTDTSITEKIPFVGGHAYSAVSNRLIDWSTRAGQIEWADYLRGRQWVDTK